MVLTMLPRCSAILELANPRVQHLQPFERTPLIGLHQPAVADGVGREDRGEAAIHPVQ